MNIKRVCQFFPDKEAGKTDGKLRYRIKYDRNTIAFNVGYRVDIDKWSAETQRCKNGTTHGRNKVQANIINREIQHFIQLSEAIFIEYEKGDKTPTADEFRETFNISAGHIKKAAKGGDSFFVAFDEFTVSMGIKNSWMTGTYTKFAALRLHLENYAPGLTFAGVNDDTLMGFLQYQQSPRAMKLTYPDALTGLRNTTVAKNISLLRWFLRWAVQRNYYKGKSHETFKPKLKGTDGNIKEVIYLSWEELMTVYSFDFATAKRTLDNGEKEDIEPETKKALERVRDVFCFCCFTSLRYSDVAKLRRTDVKGTFIAVVTKKTTDGLKIELNDYSGAILEKYKDYPFKDDLALPVISNVNMNEHLKTMGELIGLNDPQRVVYFIGNKRHEEVYPKYELLTTHCGRRTFIVNALYLGIPAEVVMRWTGHSDYKAMKPYVKIVDSLKERSMSKFNKVPDNEIGD